MDDERNYRDTYINMFDISEDGEVLFERYFKGINITADTRNYCYMLLSNIREVENSRFVDKNQSNEFELGTMTFKRSGRYKFLFDGAITNGIEGKMVDGVITIEDRDIIIETNYYRLNEFLEDDEKFYSTTDAFVQQGDRTIRITTYSDGMKFTEEVDLLSGEEVDEFAIQKSKYLLSKKRNKMSN